MRNGNVIYPPKSEDNVSPSPSKILALGYLIYFTYSVSIAVDGQFLSLYYKSKGFDATTLGVLYSLTPLTTFLTVPVWGILTNEHVSRNGNKTNSKSERALKRPFRILCMNIVISTICQVSLAVFDEPIYMMLAITIAAIFQSPAKPMIDGIMMDHMEDRSNFGKIRFFSIIGSGLGTNLGGRILTVVERSTTNINGNLKNSHTVRHDNRYFWDMTLKMFSGFNLLFLARLVLTIPPIICIRQLKVASMLKIKNRQNSNPNQVSYGSKRTINQTTSTKDKEQGTSILSLTRDMTKLCFGDKNNFLFFLCIFIAGVSGGVSDAFSYPRYQESGCSTMHMGQSRLLSSCSAAIMFWYSGSIARCLGIKNVLVLSMLCAGIRFSLLSRMDHPYYIYLVDFIRSTTFGAFWSCSTLYASQIGPPSIRKTILLLLNGIYNGIGRSTGAILGGKLQAISGTDNLFHCCARINYLLAFLMSIFYIRENKGIFIKSLQLMGPKEKT